MFWVPLQRPVGLNSLGGARINQPADREFASLHANLRYLYANRPLRAVVRLRSNFILSRATNGLFYLASIRSISQTLISGKSKLTT